MKENLMPNIGLEGSFCNNALLIAVFRKLTKS